VPSTPVRPGFAELNEHCAASVQRGLATTVVDTNDESPELVRWAPEKAVSVDVV
jgi:hypothetical protein